MPLELIELPAADPTLGAKKPPLLFIHGSFCSAPIWARNFMPYFSKLNFDCYAVSLRGHGKSRSKESLHFHSLNDYVDDIAWAAQRLDRTPVLVGHSLGGMAVMKYMEDHPFAGTVLLNSVPPSGAMASAMHMFTKYPDLYWSMMAVMYLGPDSMSFDTLKRLLLSPGGADTDLKAMSELFQAESLRAISDVTYFDVPRKKPQSPAPVLVMGGDADKMIPTSALMETAAFYEASLEVITDLPHASMVDVKWQDAADRMGRWLGELTARQHQAAE